MLVVDGRVVGIAGLARWTAFGVYEFFSDFKPEVRGLLRCTTVIRHLLKLKPWIRACRFPVYAVAQETEPDSERLLEHFGFVRVKGALFQWQC